MLVPAESSAAATQRAAETVAGLDSEEPTGVFFDEQTAEAVAAAVQTFESNSHRISATACRRRAERFSAARFRSEFAAFVARKYREWRAYCGGNREAPPAA